MAKNVGIVLLGPWGGEGGNPWSYSVVGEITNISITHDSNGVNSVRFMSKDANGTVHKSPEFGVPNGTGKEIVIDPNVEKLVSIEGSVGIYNSVKRVTSLGFTTTKTKHEPVGTGNKDTEFVCLLSKDPFTGFHGRSGPVLNSIGISIYKTQKIDVAGPWPASAGGEPWDYTSKGPICQIFVSYNDDIVRSLQFASRDAFGVLHKSDTYGDPEGAKVREINIDTTIEKITGISGAYGPYGGASSLVKSVTFITNNMKLLGPFGTQKDGDTTFSYSVQGENVVTGFFGGAGSLIDAIGLKFQSSKSSAVMVGPINGKEGNSWTYEAKGIITRIFVTHSGAVHTLQFETIDANGKTELSQVYGTSPGANKYTVNIEKDDKITNISGTIRDFGSSGLFVTGMYISTEKYVCGPFGSVGKGITFSYPIKDGYISGFHGKSTHALKGLGVYVKPT